MTINEKDKNIADKIQKLLAKAESMTHGGTVQGKGTRPDSGS